MKGNNHMWTQVNLKEEDRKLRAVAKTRALAHAVVRETMKSIAKRSNRRGVRQAVLDEVIELLSATWIGGDTRNTASLYGSYKKPMSNGHALADQKIGAANAKYIASMNRGKKDTRNAWTWKELAGVNGVNPELPRVKGRKRNGRH
jgi:hypothetical protein